MASEKTLPTLLTDTTFILLLVMTYLRKKTETHYMSC